MIRIKLMDGSVLEIPREEALELLPYRGVNVSAMFKDPIEGLLIHRGKLIPVLGPMPTQISDNVPIEQRPWLLLLRGCAQVILGLPQFDEAVKSEVVPFPGGTENAESGGLLQELDQLLKAV